MKQLFIVVIGLSAGRLIGTGFTSNDFLNIVLGGLLMFESIWFILYKKDSL